MKRNSDSLPLTPSALLPYCRDCRDLLEWPERWMGEEKDLPPGRRLVEYFMPFLLHIAGSGQSKRTIQNHVDNMWLLGGEIIREVNENPSLRKATAEQLVRNVIHEEGGPLIRSSLAQRMKCLFIGVLNEAYMPTQTVAVRVKAKQRWLVVRHR
jgi:hypothetical protein